MAENSGDKREVLTPKELKDIEKKLHERHSELSEQMGLLEGEIREPLLGDSEEALSMKEEDDIVEEEDSIEESEIFQIEEALGRISEGTFGICFDCGKAIPLERLKIVPYAKYCVRCQEKREKKK